MNTGALVSALLTSCAILGCACAFGIWQHSFYAGLWMLMVLVLMAGTLVDVRTLLQTFLILHGMPR